MAGVVIAVVARRRAGSRRTESAEPIATATSNAALQWDSLVTPAFTLYAQRGGYAADRLPELRSEVDSAITHALEILGEPGYRAHLRVFYVRSREDVKAVTGMAGMGITRAAYNAVVLVAADTSRPAHRHEVMHAVSLRLWGQPGATPGDPREPSNAAVFYRGGWLREGLATTADKGCVPWSVRGIAAQMVAENERIPLDTLTAAFYQKDGLSAYLQGGSLVQFLLLAYGRDRFKRLWHLGADSIAAVYGKPSATIEAEWLGWLKATPEAERPPSLAAVRGPGCK
ncbi:MAG: hypothetical protein HOP28_14545 [Gemmatimonadales bacterium]|nr:hypothetical protein [Gemmatimonadales bacterium]